MRHQGIKGIYHDRLLRSNGEVEDFGWRANIVVDRCRTLLASFMKGDAVTGVQYIALGRGETIWDDLPYEAPSASTFELVDVSPETILASSPDMTVDFVDNLGVVTATPGQRIMVSVAIVGSSLPIVGDETFPLREFALFGQIGIDDYMIDYVRHPVMNIGIGDTLERSVQLNF